METQLVTKTLRPGSLEEHSFKSCVAIDTAAKIQITSNIFPFFFLLLYFPLSSVFLPSSIFALLCEFSVLYVNYF